MLSVSADTDRRHGIWWTGWLSSIDIIVISFLVSVLIAIIAVIAGVGGGVIFTPLLLAFTSFDTLVIRSTGLVVAMFSG